MREDYLFEKSGSDPEIERLEGLLGAFGQKEMAAPLIAGEISRAGISWKDYFSMKPAFALAMGIAIISFALFILFEGIGPNLNSVAKNEGLKFKVSNPKSLENFSLDAFDAEGPKPAFKRIAAEKASFRRPARQRIPPALDKNGPQPFIKGIRPKRAIRRNDLSDEERFAYEQLRLALSITGEKLKIVKEKIDGEIPSDRKEKGIIDSK